MHKVLLAVPNSKNWIGGLNYFRNLAKALYALPDRQLEFVLLTHGGSLGQGLDELSRINATYPNAEEGFVNKVKRKFFRDILQKDSLDKIMKKNSIDIFSHGYYIGKLAKTPTLHWIPDLQEKFLPQFFSPEEISKRTAYQSKLAFSNQKIIFSSQSAANDFNKFFPKNNSKQYVLQFVSLPGPQPTHEKTQEILKSLNIPQKFFFLPNQFWGHKNHIVVIEALHILKSKGFCPKVICTGATDDYRNPKFYKDLTDKVKTYGLEEDFVILGLVDYEVVKTLMYCSVAVINPSLFEGWSTTVEEAKSLGKKILLSNINVHLEQAPSKGVYFDPQDPEALSKLITETYESHNPENEQGDMDSAKLILQERFLNFGRTYQNIVLDVIKNAAV